MLVRLLGFLDLFAGVLLFLLQYDIGRSLGLIVGLYLVAKGVVFLMNVVSVMDLLAGVALILAAQGHYFFFTWVFVLWLLQKGFFPHNVLMQQLTLMNLHLALFNMLPIPTLDGFKTYIGSPLMFSFFFTMIIIAFFFLQVMTPLFTLIFAFIIACGVILVHWNNKFVQG